MSTRTSDGRRARAPQSPYVPPGARGRASAESRLNTSPHNDLKAPGSVPEREDGSGRRAGGGGEAGQNNREGKASAGRPSRRVVRNAQQPVSTATARSTEAAKAEEPPCGQPSTQPPLTTASPLPNNAPQGDVGRRDEKRQESEACGDLQPSACLSNTASPLGPPAERSRETRAGGQNTRKSRQAWSKHVPPRSRGCSSSSSCIEESQNSEADVTRFPSETSPPPAPRLPEGAEVDDNWPASTPAERVPETAVSNATKKASRRRGGRGTKGASESSSVATVQRESEEAVNVSAAMVEAATGERPNCDAISNARRETPRVARQEDAPLASHGAAAAEVPRVPCGPPANHIGCSAGPRRDDLAEAVEGDALDAATSGAKSQTRFDNCAASISEAAATPSPVTAADRTPESSIDEGAGSAESTLTCPCPVGSGDDEVAESCKASSMSCERKDGEKTPRGFSAQTELEAGQATTSKKVEGRLGSVASPEGSICNDTEAKGKDEESQEMPLLKAPFARYVPPGRRKLLDSASTSADGAAGGMGPLWTSRAPIRVSQRPRPSDGEASPTRPSPARVAAVVGGGMSAYGANISEYSGKSRSTVKLEPMLPRGLVTSEDGRATLDGVGAGFVARFRQTHAYGKTV